MTKYRRIYEWRRKVRVYQFNLPHLRWQKCNKLLVHTTLLLINIQILRFAESANWTRKITRIVFHFVKKKNTIFIILLFGILCVVYTWIAIPMAKSHEPSYVLSKKQNCHNGRSSHTKGLHVYISYDILHVVCIDLSFFFFGTFLSLIRDHWSHPHFSRIQSLCFYSILLYTHSLTLTYAYTYVMCVNCEIWFLFLFLFCALCFLYLITTYTYSKYRISSNFVCIHFII